MKQLIALLLCVCLCLGCTFAQADGRMAPADKGIVTTDDKVNGYTTSYRKYDAKFYDEPSEQPGTVVKVSYTTEVYGKPIENWVNVYLPYGYDENGTEKYDIMYFYHGTNETQDSFIGDARAKNCIDNLIETGIAKPFIMVFPTYYFDYDARSCDLDLFQQEMRHDVMPAVEGTYRTYAESTDDAGLAASREHRAIAGYSQGCRMCWYSFKHLLDTAYYFLPMSNAVGVQGIIDAVDRQADYRSDFFVYIGCGGARDGLHDATVNLVNELLSRPGYFSFGTDSAENNLYLTISKDVHQTLIARYFIYNAFCDVLWKSSAD